MTPADALAYAQDVLGVVLPNATVELIEQAGHPALKVVDGERNAVLQLRDGADQAFEIRALGSELKTLRELAVTRRALEKESARVLELEALLAPAPETPRNTGEPE